MYKIRLFSDLHLEGRKYEIPALPGDAETILILAGDIHTGNNATAFIDPLLKRFREVVYVLGNHEFYHNDMNDVRTWWRKAQRYRTNFHVLDNGVLDCGDLRIIGTTLWTHTNDPEMARYLNDYACIHKNGRVLTPADTRELFLQNVEFLVDELEAPFDGKTVVVTHHAPAEVCVRPRWVGHFLTKCFAANLDWLIEWYDIDMWLHGHMHDTVHITHAGTEIFCNPRGYAGTDSNPNFTDDLVIEL